MGVLPLPLLLLAAGTQASGLHLDLGETYGVHRGHGRLKVPYGVYRGHVKLLVPLHGP